MTLSGLMPESFFNWTLAKQPLNWAIVWVFASLWLLLFHVVMVAWQSMMAPDAVIQAAPGQVAMLPDVTQAFSIPGFSDNNSDLALFQAGGGTGMSPWGADGVMARYAEDGWAGN